MPERLRPFRPISPGEILQDELVARGWTQSDLAEILDRPVQAINEIISGKKAIVPPTAVEFSLAFNTSPEFWLNLESAYRLDLLHHKGGDGEEIARRAKVYSLVSVKDIQKKGWITKTKDLDVIEKDVCKLLGIKSLEEKPTLALAARKSDSYTEFSPAQIAWACRARQMARRQKVKPFNPRLFNAQVDKLPSLSVEEDNIKQVVKTLADIGIRLVIVEHLPQTYIDGACFWLTDKSPVVALSLRYDRIDYFFFTLMHELAHIKRNSSHTVHVDDNLVGPSAEAREGKPEEEQDADNLASEWLLPNDDVNTFIADTKPYYSKKAILAFADKVGVHPGIVVGRLQYLGEISYSHSRGMLVKVWDKLLEK